MFRSTLYIHIFIRLFVQPNSNATTCVIEERSDTRDVLLTDSIDVSTAELVPSGKVTANADSLMTLMVVRTCLGGVKIKPRSDAPADPDQSYPNPYLVHTCLLEENDAGRQFVVQERSQCYLEYIFQCSRLIQGPPSSPKKSTLDVSEIE